ncbi:MAG: hypothetical protein KY453_12495 [Gemmatimonadetes bacterium]|nr:hypothetical protein [Gemmatimonadota bacterium]
MTRNDRITTLLQGRRERLARELGRPLAQRSARSEPLSPRVRGFMLDEAKDLYWNELEWEHITHEEVTEEGHLAELTFPGLLAFVRGLLLEEVMPDALAPADPRPEVVEDLLVFLAARVPELEEALSSPDDEDDEARCRRELDLTSRLLDLVLYLYHRVERPEVERLEAARAD